MADFYQVGVIATFHRLEDPRQALDRLEDDLTSFSRQWPIALVLPALFSEFEGEALPHILSELASVRYLGKVVLSLDRADRTQFEHARRELSRLPVPTTVVWHDGPRLQTLYKDLASSDLAVGEQGKGRSCWLSFGYVLAEQHCKVIALHDTDILTYDRSMLARLCYPVGNPAMGYEFCKGYYPRVSNRRMHGRVTRLFMTPLIRSLYKIIGYHPYLVYLDSFRYVLAGEFALRTELARTIRIPSDWGLEVGTLAEVYRNTSLRRLCQVSLSDRYDHKHRDLSADDPQSGLLKMTIDIAKSLFRTLASEGIILSTGTVHTLRASYVRTAEDTIKRFRDDAALNGLEFDIHAEELAVATFANALKMASEQFLHDPLGAPLIPNWNRVLSALPSAFDQLKNAVDRDNQ
jgi:glucosyl-3-phosphoglycerate synthase